MKRQDVPRFAVLQHAESEGPGLIVRHARRYGVELSMCRVYRGERLPLIESIDGLIVLGGPMSVLDTDRQHLELERGLVGEALARGMPILGICLGAQLLAQAAGGRVFRGVREEGRVGTISLTPAGWRDPVLGSVGDRPEVLHWHEDWFDVPVGATLLATDHRFRNQAVRLGDCAYGMQFHFEVDAEHARAIRPHLPGDVLLTSEEQARIERTGDAIVDRFLDLAVAQPGGSVA